MNTIQLERIGKTLKQKRKQLGYTQEAAAEKIHISYSYYTKIENGKQLPSLEVAVNISRVFHLSLDKWLFGEDAELTNASPEYYELIKSIKNIDTESVRNIQNVLSKMIEYAEK